MMDELPLLLFFPSPSGVTARSWETLKSPPEQTNEQMDQIKPPPKQTNEQIDQLKSQGLGMFRALEVW